MLNKACLVTTLPRQLKVLALLLAFVLGPFAGQVVCKAAARCCCAGTELKAGQVCHCGDSHSSTDCSFQCNSEQPQALLESGTVLPEREQPQPVFMLSVFNVLLKTTAPQRAAARWSMRWVLPSTPPLLAAHLALPPPTQS